MVEFCEHCTEHSGIIKSGYYFNGRMTTGISYQTRPCTANLITSASALL